MERTDGEIEVYEPEDTDLEPVDDGRCHGIRRDGTRCGNSSKLGSRYCRHHLQSSMVAASRENEGRYARSLPKQMVPEYQAALQDAYLLHLRDEVAVIGSRINQLLSETEEGVNAKTWKEIKALWTRFAKAYRQDNIVEANELMLRLGELIETGKRESDLWSDVERLLEQRRKLVETEQKYLRSAGQTLTLEAAMVLLSAAINALKESVRKYVGSREVQEAIIVDAQYEYTKLVGGFGGGEGT